MLFRLELSDSFDHLLLCISAWKSYTDSKAVRLKLGISGVNSTHRCLNNCSGDAKSWSLNRTHVQFYVRLEALSGMQKNIYKGVFSSRLLVDKKGNFSFSHSSALNSFWLFYHLLPTSEVLDTAVLIRWGDFFFVVCDVKSCIERRCISTLCVVTRKSRISTGSL